MTDQTCKTCKWWGERPYLLDYQDGLRQYEDHKDDYKGPQKSCGCPKIVDASDANTKDKRALSSDSAWYSDQEEYGALFRTGPDFGCVHHSPKE